MGNWVNAAAVLKAAAGAAKRLQKWYTNWINLIESNNSIYTLKLSLCNTYSINGVLQIVY
jgi:hypothetical protein